MPILNLKLNNILSFSNFEINFSYPIKLRRNLIGEENLESIPSFRYKKLNVFVGANASGKTSLMKCIWKILLFLRVNEKQDILEIVNKKFEESYIEVDLADELIDGYYLRRYKIKIINKANDSDILVSQSSLKLNNGDSYESRVKDFNNIEDDYKNYIEALGDARPNDGWNLTLPATESGFDKIKFIDTKDKKEENEYLDILNRVLKTLDPAIISVKKSLDADNAISIEHEGSVNKLILQAGNPLANVELLSSGTKYGINIANIIYSITKHINGIYLIDEQFSYVNSDVEEAMLSTMVSMLGANEQLFFTTHNANILSLGYPFHSFYFLKKIGENGKKTVKVSCASEVENRNNVSPKSLLDNDVFSTAPDVNKIFELGEIHE